MTDDSTSAALMMRQQMMEKAIYEQVVGYAFDYLDSVNERTVWPSATARAELARFEEPLPTESQDAAMILALLHEAGSPATVAQIGGRYFGFVNGGAVPTAVAARWLADIWDQNGALAVMSPIAAKLEQVCETWLVDLLGLPATTVAGFVGGTSTATLCGLLAGRNHLLTQLGWSVQRDGLFGAPRLRVVMSTEAHGTVRKALAVLGIGSAQIEWVPADAQGRFMVEKDACL